MVQILSTEYLSLMIVTKNGDLKVAFVEASDNLWAPKASYEINCSILVLINEGLCLDLWSMLCMSPSLSH
jgi:hypothetical protein